MSTTKRNSRQTDRAFEIDLFQIFNILWKNLSRIILAALILGIVALLVTIVFIHPTYQARFSVYVNNRNASSSGTDVLGSSDVMASQSLAKTYAKIITSRPVIEDAAESTKMNKEYDYDMLKEVVTAAVEQDTQLVEVSVIMQSPEEAYSLAAGVADAAPAYVADVVEGSSMKVVAKPVLPTKQYAPSPKKNTAIGFLLGAVLMAVYLVLREILDDRIKSDEELEERYGISIIGTVPNFFAANSDAYGGYYARGSKKGGRNKKWR